MGTIAPVDPTLTGGGDSGITPQNQPAQQDQNQIDPHIAALTKAIGLEEQDGKVTSQSYNAVGDNGHSGGLYQWNDPAGNLQPGQIPANFKSFASEVGADPTDFSPANQDKVAYQTMALWNKPVAQGGLGLTPQQIASKWNSGNPNAYKGTPGYNAAQGVSYDTPTYVKNVGNYYNKVFGANTANASTTTPPDTTGVEDQSPKTNTFFDALGTTQGGDQSNVPQALQIGNDTWLGRTWNNINSVTQDVGIGAVKSLIATPLHLAQFEGKILGNTGNNAFNADSSTGQYLNNAVTGNNFSQKFGKTATDIGTLFAPGGAVSRLGNVVEAGAETIPRLGELASQTGLAGRAARFVPKLASSLAETYAGNAALTGNAGFNSPGNFVSAVTAPFIAPILRGVGAVLSGPEGKAALAEKASTNLANAIANNDPFGIGRYKQEVANFENKVRGAFSNSAGKIPQTILSNADRKLGTTEQNVIQNIFNNGMVDGTDNKGRAITTNAQDRQTGIIQKNAGLLDKQLASSNEKVDATQIANQTAADIEKERTAPLNAGGNEGTVVANKAKILGQVVEENPALQKQNATPLELNQLSQKLRSEAYNTDKLAYQNSKATGTPIDTTKADVFRQLASSIDDRLYGKVDDATGLVNGGVGDINKVAANTLRKNQSLAYTTRSVLQAMENVKFGNPIGNKLSRAAGAAIGWAHGGFFGAAVGSQAAEKISTMAARAYGDSNLASQKMEQFGLNATKADFTKLENLVNEDVTKNTAIKTAADRVKAEANRLKELKDLFDKTNEGSKYISEDRLPTIDYGKPATPKLAKENAGLPVAEGAPNVSAPTKAPAPVPKKLKSLYEPYTPENQLPVIDYGKPGVSKYKKATAGLPIKNYYEH